MYYSTDGGQTWSEYTVQAFDGMPVGTVVLFAGETAPQYWMICDGTSLSEEEYPQLFDVIGYKYGGSNLSFNLPDLRGKVPVGLKSTDTSFDTLGETGGSKTTSYTPAGTNTGGSVGNHTLTVQEMPSHSHNLNTCMNSGANTTNDKVLSANASSSWNGNSHNEIAIVQNGGGQAHNHPFTQPTFSGTQANIDIVQPYLTLNYIIKVTTNAPVMGSVVTVQNNSNVDTYSCSYINNELDSKQDELTNIYIGSQTLCYNYNRSNTHINETVYGAYNYQLIEGIFVGITIPQGYHKAYRLTASGTNSNGESVYVWINNISTNPLITYSNPSFRVIVSSPIFTESDIVLEPTLNYTHTLGTNLKVTSTGTTSVDLVDITIHGYIQKD